MNNETGPREPFENVFLRFLLRVLLICLLLGVMFLGIVSRLEAVQPPSAWNLATLASWSQPLTASGTLMIATTTGYLPGDLYILYDPASWTTFRLNASGSWVQQVASGTGGSTGADPAAVAHIASTTGVHGVPGSLAADASLTAHINDTVDPHGASMTVSEEITVGSGNATATVRNIGTYTVEIASYIRLLPVTATPSGALNGTIWNDANTQKLRFLESGTWIDLH